MPTERILGIDIGIKNLACAILEVERENGRIVGPHPTLDRQDWFIINTTPDSHQHQCCFVGRKACETDASCHHTDKTTGEERYYCNTHRKAVTTQATKQGQSITWRSLNRNQISSMSIVHSMYAKLDQYLDRWNRLDYIVIEKQPPKNPKMKTVMNHIFDYFVVRLMIDNPTKRLRDILFIEAKYKVHYGRALLSPERLETINSRTPESRNKYAYNKAVSIAATEHLLGEWGYGDALEWFRSQSKRDDYADCFVETLAWLDIEDRKAMGMETKGKKRGRAKGRVNLVKDV